MHIIENRNVVPITYGWVNFGIAILNNDDEWAFSFIIWRFDLNFGFTK